MPETEQPNNAVLEVKIDYLLKDVQTIKTDVKEIKNDYLTRREYADSNREMSKIQNDHETRTRKIETFISNLKGKYAMLAVLGMLIVGIVGSVVGSSVIKAIQSDNCPTTLICTPK